MTKHADVTWTRERNGVYVSSRGHRIVKVSRVLSAGRSVRGWRRVGGDGAPIGPVRRTLAQAKCDCP
jgi:hypothetical protein